MQRNRYILIVLLVINYHFSFSNFNLEFEHLTSNNGLSSEEVREIFQDSNGFIWFLTPNGLNKYDGYEIQIFNTGNDQINFTSNSFECICEDAQGSLWLGTAEKGLLIFDPNRLELVSFEAMTKGHSLFDSHIRTLLFPLA